MTQSTNPYRDQVIEEVAQEILKMKVFGQDTLNSFAIYIRQMKYKCTDLPQTSKNMENKHDHS
jgi:hypothetical protein